MELNDLEKITYIIYRPFDFSCSQKQLSYIYAPIVGSTAISFYQWLINEYNVQTALKGIKNPITRILHCLNCTNNEFAEIRSQLEAINLISTHTQTNNDEKIMHIAVNEPLNWKEFNNNQKFKHLLINKIGIREYERISLAFTNRRIPSDTINISASFEAVFGTGNISEIMEFNFQNLHELLSSDFQQPVILNEAVKIVIESFFKSHDLSINEIKKCVSEATFKNNKDGLLYVDQNLLIDNFNNLTTAAINIDLNENLQIYRNPEIFYNELLNQNEINRIFNDYRNINAERYLVSIQKDSLDLDQKQTIAYLRKKSHLEDSVINILTDFTIYRTNGKYSSNYIKKIATTINRLGLTSLDKILNYLHSVNNNLKTQKYHTDGIDRVPSNLVPSKKIMTSPSVAVMVDDEEVNWKTIEIM